LICSGIGGMAEKVRNGVDGLHVEPGNAHAWASALAYAAQSLSLWDELTANITPRMPLSQAAALYIDLIVHEAPVTEPTKKAQRTRGLPKALVA
jgi:glycosyltransferase involved in cell wall biosynthesis